ncbi:MAG: hypothetical protein HFH84_08670 [Lachnospiraceae bacterium]|nr:hypothetical protein [Lachnospiraceae bacterium]
MARGQRKTIEEKIAAKEELIEALATRMESEKRELEELYQEKRRKELEVVSDIIAESGLEPDEVAEVLQQYLENREAAAS